MRAAIPRFTKLSRFRPDYAMAYFARGYANLQKGDYDKAISDLSEAIKLQPGGDQELRQRAFSSRGTAYISQKNWEQAIADYTDAIRLDPDDFSSYNARGTAYSVRKEYKNALADITEAIRLRPDRMAGLYYLNRASIYREMGEADKARADTEKAKSLGITVPKFLEKREVINGHRLQSNIHQLARRPARKSSPVQKGERFARWKSASGNVISHRTADHQQRRHRPAYRLRQQPTRQNTGTARVSFARWQPDAVTKPRPGPCWATWSGGRNWSKQRMLTVEQDAVANRSITSTNNRPLRRFSLEHQTGARGFAFNSNSQCPRPADATVFRLRLSTVLTTLNPTTLERWLARSEKSMACRPALGTNTAQELVTDSANWCVRGDASAVDRQPVQGARSKGGCKGRLPS